jgi:Glycosyl hydrolase family 26
MLEVSMIAGPVLSLRAGLTGVSGAAVTATPGSGRRRRASRPGADGEEDGVGGRAAARAAGAAGVVLALLAVAGSTVQAAPSRTPKPTASPRAGGAAAGGSGESELMGLAAIAGAGLQVRHVMKVPGPDPSIDLGHLAAASPSPTPSATATPSRVPVPAGPVGGIPVAWHSGASGDAAVTGSFGSWRGSTLKIISTWSDTTADSQRNVDSLGAYSGWNGDLDIAIGGLVSGESWSAAASGAYADRWAHAIGTIKAQRAGRSGVTYVRFAHEMTGDWFPWKVNSGNVAGFKKAWRLFAGLLRRDFPQAKLVFSPNDGSSSDISLDQIWPGDDVVDVVGPDSYDGYPNKTSQGVWDDWFTSTRNGPLGLGAWRQFAVAHGKPLALPEWGLRNQDNAFYITKMHEFLASCAPRPGQSLAGRCIYDVYFNIANGGNSGFMIYGGPNPNAADAYRSLRWGSG